MGVCMGSPDFGRVCWRIVRPFHTAPKRVLHDWVAPVAFADDTNLFPEARSRQAFSLGVRGCGVCVHSLLRYG